MWMVVVIIAREFLITGLRLIAANRQLVLAAERVGKQKTVTQMLAILLSLGYLSLGELGFGSTKLAVALRSLLCPFFWLALLVTAISGAIYFYRNRFLFDQTLVSPKSRN
jgi:CDP-diacylglycerol--glycerol-3-phosphate 3-phosphatidyltransferase